MRWVRFTPAEGVYLLSRVENTRGIDFQIDPPIEYLTLSICNKFKGGLASRRVNECILLGKDRGAVGKAKRKWKNVHKLWGATRLPL